MRALLSFLLASLAFGLGGINCEICQDVVGAFRRGWPSLGARSLSSPVTLTLDGKAARGGGGAGVGGSAIAPAPPGCGAFAPGSPLRAACVHTRCVARARRRARRRAHATLPTPLCASPPSLPLLLSVSFTKDLEASKWLSLATIQPPATRKSEHSLCVEKNICDTPSAVNELGNPTDTSNARAVAALACSRAASLGDCLRDPNCAAYEGTCTEQCVACLCVATRAAARWALQKLPRGARARITAAAAHL